MAKLTIVVKRRIASAEICFLRIVLLVAVSSLAVRSSSGQPSTLRSSPVKSVVDEYCTTCHDETLKKGGLDLENINFENVAQHPEIWEKVIRKLTARQMPPIGKDRPSDKTYDLVVAQLAASLDRASAKNPNPGRTETFRR